MGNNIKTWISGIALVIVVLSSLVGYIYAEATGSRCRDAETMAYVVVQDNRLRAQIHDSQIVVMNGINQILVEQAKMQSDIRHIKRGV